MARSRVVVDIETVGVDWGLLSEHERSYLTRRASGDNRAAQEQSARETLALSPLTGEVVLIGMENPDTGRGLILARLPTTLASQTEAHARILSEIHAALDTAGRGTIRVVLALDERSLLERFWEMLQKYDQVVSFNGRTFDGPFLMLRSMALGVEIPRGCDLTPNRYHDTHIDLLDRLSFFGVARTVRYSLDFWCRRLGIASPKALMRGSEVQTRWDAGDLVTPCVYLAGDLRATSSLYEKYLSTFGRLYGWQPIDRGTPSPGNGSEDSSVPAK